MGVGHIFVNVPLEFVFHIVLWASLEPFTPKIYK